MRARCAVVLLALLACMRSSPGQDFQLVTEAGTRTLRLHRVIDGQSPPSVRDRFQDRLFAYLDADRDGSLSKAEAARAPSLAFLTAFAQGHLPAAAQSVAPFAELDRDADGRVRRAEFDAYYGGASLDELRVIVIPTDPATERLLDILFDLLDRDRNGGLSHAELRQAGEALGRADFNGDEWIARDELLLLRLVATGAPRPAPRLLPRTAPGRPDLELRIRLETRRQVGLAGPRAEVIGTAGLVLPLPDGLRVTAGRLELDVQMADGPETSVRTLHQFLRQEFQAAGGQGVLTRAQAEEVPLLAGLFALADRDGDDRLTEQELSAFLDLHALAAVSFTTLTLADRSPGLFELLDADGDGKLSVHELATAGDRLRIFARDGKLSRADLPCRIQVRLTQGKAGPLQATAVPAASILAAARGPTWFHKTDRNGDGYISRREWLGTDEQFRRFDRDGDGLISRAEAEFLETKGP